MTYIPQSFESYFTGKHEKRFGYIDGQWKEVDPSSRDYRYAVPESDFDSKFELASFAS